MTERGLRISEVNGWDLDKLGLDSGALGRLVTKLDGLMQSMLIEQDDLAESWNGPGASAAADRVVNEKTAGSHISAKIDEIKDQLTTGQIELQDAKTFVLSKRTSITDLGFGVDDRGIVSASDKITQLNKAGGDRGDVMSAGLALMAEAGRYTTEMLQALQHAQGVAKGVQARLVTLKDELNTLMIQEAPSKAIRASGLVPGVPPGGATPFDLGPLGATQSLQNGVPVVYTDPEGKTTTITPNPDGTRTVAQSVTGPDGTTTTTTSTNGGPPTTTVTQPRGDGSGIVDTTITGPDGKQRRLQTVPKGEGRSTTYAVEEDGRIGAAISESYPAPNGGLITDVHGAEGAFDREWRRPDGYREFDRYVPDAEGTPQLVGSSNSAGVQSTMNADGTIDTKYPNGQSARTITLPDGIVLTKFSDDSVLSYDPGKVPEGTPVANAWDTVKSWTTQQWNEAYGSTVGTLEGHPVASGAGVAGSGLAEGANQMSKTLAGQAAESAGRAADASSRAFSLLDSGAPGPASRAVVESIDHTADAASAASKAGTLANTAKFGGGALTAGLAIYTNVDDVLTDGKGIYEAAGNATGGTVGGIAGAAGGAWAGGAVGAMTGPAAPVMIPTLSILGAMAGGFFGGAGGSYVGDKAGSGVRGLFEEG